ncbi:MAG: exopolysaccharide biosynthesis polyprenyl glycosylphosphotransferase [Flavobacteriaceae bacterium]
MKKKNSFFIRPLNILFDIIAIVCINYFVANEEYTNNVFLIYITSFWLISSYYTGFYNVYRYTHLDKLVKLLISHYFIFALSYLSYFTIFREGKVVDNQLYVFVLIITTVTFFKLLFFVVLKRYRAEGRNYRNIILFGDEKTAKRIKTIITDKTDLGYRFFGFFSDRVYKSKEYLGNVNNAFDYILDNKIDEVYCDPSKVTQSNFKRIRKFVNKNQLELRLIPESKAIYSKDFILEYYGIIPILKPKPLPFEQIENIIIKRIFDVFFSLVICLFILSWFLPLMWVIVKLDSKGPLFFKQKRDGANGEQFYCYKLRSMKINAEADTVSATKNDERVTRVGAFLRRTSLDELPQFFNVFKGEMSVVGPRPHINIQTKKYLKEVDNYIIRNSIKPGITGLAQVSGFRGEVVKKSDIDNRVRLDIFYIENWSFFLDLKIIFQTIFKMFLKEDKAY